MNFGNQNQPMNLYQNPGYNFERRKRQTLILDIDDSTETHLGTAGEFSVELFEPLLIDKDSEIYLDNFISFNSNIAGHGDDSAFCLTINEFNIQTNVATNSSDKGQHHFNKLIIPNEHSSVDTYFGAVVHKGKKYNYVCDINPGKIGRISGKITNLAGESVFHGADAFRTHMITGIPSGFITKAIPIRTSITITSGLEKDNVSGSIQGTMLVTSLKDASTIIFSTKFQNALSFVSGGSLKITTYGNSNGTPTSGLHLSTEPGRFIAEFTIVSKE